MYDREQYILSDLSLKEDLIKLFSKKEKLTIFDIGGCEGEDSIRYSRLFPNAEIFVFEPLPNNQKLIQENFSRFKADKVKLITEALSDIQSFEDFYVSSGRPENMHDDMNWNFGNKSSSLLPPEKLEDLIPWLKFKDVIKVTTNTLENFVNSYSITVIDFVHMDVQGAELKVLKGAGSFITNIKAIWLEVSNDELYKGQAKRNDIELFMRKKNFKLIKTVFDGVNGDQLYLNERYFKKVEFFGWKKYLKIGQLL